MMKPEVPIVKNLMIKNAPSSRRIYNMAYCKETFCEVSLEDSLEKYLETDKENG